MSVIRRSEPESRGVYIYSYDDSKWHCSCCQLGKNGGDTYMRWRVGLAFHMLRHWWAGHITAPTVALRAFEDR